MAFLGLVGIASLSAAPIRLDYRTGILTVETSTLRPRREVLSALLAVPWVGSESLHAWASKRADRKAGLSLVVRQQVSPESRGPIPFSLARLGPWMPEVLEWSFEASQAEPPKQEGPVLSLVLPEDLPPRFRPGYLPEVRSLSGRRLLPRTLALTRALARGDWIQHRRRAPEESTRLGLPVRSVTSSGVIYLHDEVAEKFEAILLEEPPRSLRIEYPEEVPVLEWDSQPEAPPPD